MSEVHVAWITTAPDTIHRGYWDQAWLEAFCTGGLWAFDEMPTFIHHLTTEEVPAGSGAIVVLPARWHVDFVDWVNEQISRLPWVILVLTGDEEGAFPRKEIQHPNMQVWIQTPHPQNAQDGDVLIGDFWRPETRKGLREFKDVSLHRGIDWFFAGQINNTAREACLEQMRQSDLPGVGEFHTTRIFGSGLDYDAYLYRLAATKVALCPSGTFTPDTFRLFEALEAGCIPIADSFSPKNPEVDYWPWLFGEVPPFPRLNVWDDLLELYTSLRPRWLEESNRIFAWWMEYKRRIARKLADTLTEMQPDVQWSTLPVTALVPTSPTPSHPDTAAIEETVQSIRARIPGIEIILMIDGVREEQSHRRRQYLEYVQRILWLANHEWLNVLPLFFTEHTHQANMTRRALKYVRTPQILFVEHDTPLIGDIPWRELCAVISSGAARLIRLHHEASIHPEHEHLMLDTGPRDVLGLSLLRTAQWSQRPHFASTEFYTWLIGSYFGRSARTMIEDTMHGIVQTHWNEYGSFGWDLFRLWMYAPAGDMKRSTHLDTRGDDPKYPMHVTYDIDAPMGAPGPTQ